MVMSVYPTNSFIRFEQEELEKSIVHRFEQQVKKYPERIALKTKNHTLTYNALNQAANRIARAILAKRGQGAEPVALLFEPSAMLFITILGVLKSGKFWTLLDPSHLQNKNKKLLENLQTSLCVTDTNNFPQAAELANHDCPLINIDEFSDSGSDENPELHILPDNIAVILYTSGSTGEPKGVIRTHRNILKYIMGFTNPLYICKDDRLSCLSSLSHVAGVSTIFRALLNGAALFPFYLKKEGSIHLAHWLIQEEITIYHSIPAVFRHFIATLQGEEHFPKLRVIHLGGEPVFKRDAELYKQYFSPHCILLNSLGSTEASAYRQFFIHKKTPIADNILPAGYEVEDKEVLLFDETGQEVDCNCIGEIAVRSRYLSPGYWNDPELTRQKFLPDPEGGGKRIYLTGDLGRMRPDGCLEYLGRKDFQVKVRGYRVILTEIEAALHHLDVVKEAFVIAREHESGDTYLVAYVVSSINPAPTVDELRQILAETLPDYMIPTRFVPLETLPLTPNGKIDRKALPEPEQTRPDFEEQFIPPRTPIEKELARLWCDVLQLDRVGIHDNFFALGGIRCQRRK